MHSASYEDLLIRVENDLTACQMNPVISDTVPLHENTGLDGVTFIKGTNVFIFVDKHLDLFDKAKTLVEEYFHAISDIGNHLDYDAKRAHNDEVDARTNVITYMTSATDLHRLMASYDNQPLAAWMLEEEWGYPHDFAAETIAYYQRYGLSE